jgi:hypothetical protein
MRFRSPNKIILEVDLTQDCNYAHNGDCYIARTLKEKYDNIRANVGPYDLIIYHNGKRYDYNIVSNNGWNECLDPTFGSMPVVLVRKDKEIDGLTKRFRNQRYIVVEVDTTDFSTDVYEDGYNCYIASAVKKLQRVKTVKTGPFECTINDVEYRMLGSGGRYRVMRIIEGKYAVVLEKI